MFKLIQYTDKNGNVRYTWVSGEAGSGAVAQAINKLTGVGIAPESIKHIGSFASAEHITGDDRYGSATSLENTLSTIGSGSGDTGDGNDGSQNSGDDGFKLGGGLEEVDPQAAFRRALQSRGLIGEGRATNPAERFLQGRFDPAYSAFSIADTLRDIAPSTNTIGDQTFEEFSGGNVGNYRQIAADKFRQLGDVVAQRLGQKGNIGIADDPALQDLINPPDTAAASIAFDAARNAFRNRFSSLVSNRLLRNDSVADSLTDFRASTNGGAGNYIESLRKRYGLRVAG